MTVRLRLCWGIPVLIALLGEFNSGFAAEHSPALKKALTTYQKVMTASKDDLLKGFDAAAKSVGKRKTSAFEKTHLLAVLEAEKARFEKTGEPPWSEPMRAEFIKYLKATSQARTSLQRVVEADVNKSIKAGDNDAAKALSKEFEALVAPQTVGCWVHSAIGYPDVQATMYSNGKFTDRDGKPNGEWAYDNGLLLMRWPSSFGGFANVKVQVSDDGLTYRGGGDSPDSVLNTGRYVSLP